MSNYLYYRHEEQELDNRFDNVEGSEGYPIKGVNVWKRLISRLLNLLFPEQRQSSETEQGYREQTLSELFEVFRSDDLNFYNWEIIDIDSLSTEELIVNLLLIRLRKLYTPAQTNDCPRLFISHRQADVVYALRIAQLAQKKKFAYWVDVLDPNLQRLKGANVSERLIPLITACIIEMALINCTHVIACMTTETRGSLWLPYEYGRVTELPGKSKRASAWLHPNLVQKDFPEYMLLGESFKREDEIERWLESERHLLNKNYCSPKGGDSFSLGKIYELPTEADDEAEQRKREFEKWLNAGVPLLRDLILPDFQIKFKSDKSSKP